MIEAINLLNKQLAAISRMISDGDCTRAVDEARLLLSGPHGEHSLVKLNCAGFLIDSGDRLGDETIVREGVAILENERSSADKLSADTRVGVTYNLANGRNALLRVTRSRGMPLNPVRDMTEEEAIVALYYDVADSLRVASAETVINCASTLRLEGRVYEAMDLLDGVLHRHTNHPNAHLKMAEMLWVAFMNVGGRDRKPEALVIAALVHYERAIAIFEEHAEPLFARTAREAASRLRVLAVRGLSSARVDDAVAEVSHQQLLSVSRLGEPVGLHLLARSPYRDADDTRLIEDLPEKLRDIATDAAGTFAMARKFLRDSSADPSVLMPRWGGASPDPAAHLRYASVRQCWSVIEKVAWLINAAFDVGISDERCHFATVFRPPPKEVRAAFGLPTQQGVIRFHPKLAPDNPGLGALAGLSCAFDAIEGVYAPLKRLRHAAEHRVPGDAATADDTAFFVGIARAAFLHAIDAIIYETARKS